MLRLIWNRARVCVQSTYTSTKDITKSVTNQLTNQLTNQEPAGFTLKRLLHQTLTARMY